MVSVLKQSFISSFFLKLESEVKYCILRNYESLPKEMGDDIDCLVSSDDSVIDDIIIPIIIDLGWDYYIKYRKEGFTPIICIYTTDETVETCQIDIYTKFLWRGIRFINEEAVLNNSNKFNGFFVADHGSDIAVTIAKELLGSGTIRSKYWAKIPEFVKDSKNSFFDTLSPIYGNGIISDIYRLSENNQIEKINQFSSRLKRKLIKLKPAVYFMKSIQGFNARIKNRFKPEGKMIAFVGPDGSGKTTLIGKEELYLERLFPHNSKVYHRRYEILPELKTGHGLSSMKGTIVSGYSNLDKENTKKKRRSLISKLAAWFIVLYYTFEFMIGGAVARKLIRKRTLILYDRYYYDHFVQPATRDLIWPFRYFLLGVVRKPNLIIHLIASGEHIYKRKQDLNIKEIDIQNQYMSRVLKCCKNVVSINMETLNADQVAAEVFRIIVDRFYGIKLKKNN